VEQIELIDLVLAELKNTRQQSVSVRRICIKHNLPYSSELIRAFSETGRDFIRTFGSYGQFLDGIEKETKKTEKARSKKSFTAPKMPRGKPNVVYTKPKRKISLQTLAAVVFIAALMIATLVIYKMT